MVELNVSLRFSPTALRIIREGRRDLCIIRKALNDSPEGTSALNRLIKAFENSPEPWYQFFEESASRVCMNLYAEYLAWCDRKAAEATEDFEDPFKLPASEKSE
jgi:hypothetical protein